MEVRGQKPEGFTEVKCQKLEVSETGYIRSLIVEFLSDLWPLISDIWFGGEDDQHEFLPRLIRTL
jgi:hypothetical protein